MSACPICGSDSPANVGGQMDTAVDQPDFQDTTPHDHPGGFLDGGPEPGTIEAQGGSPDLVAPVG